MNFRLLLLTIKLAMLSVTLNGCLSTGYKLTNKKKEEPLERSTAIELEDCKLGVAFDKYNRHRNSSCAVYLGFSNVNSKDYTLKITGVNVRVEDIDHPNRIYSLSSVYWNKFVESGVGDRLTFIDSVVKNPVPFVVPFRPSNSIKAGTYYDYDHYSYAYAFTSEPKRKRLRNAKVNVTVSYEWKGKSKTVNRSFLFERFHYFLWN